MRAEVGHKVRIGSREGYVVHYFPGYGKPPEYTIRMDDGDRVKVVGALEVFGRRALATGEEHGEEES